MERRRPQGGLSQDAVELDTVCYILILMYRDFLVALSMSLPSLIALQIGVVSWEAFEH